MAVLGRPASRAVVVGCAAQTRRHALLVRVLPFARMPPTADVVPTPPTVVGESTASLGDLARRAAAGRDREAEAELCRRFAPRIRLYGLKHLRDEDRARDLVQAVLVTVIEALRGGRVDDVEHIDRFMLGTARNLAARVRHQDSRATPTAPDVLPELASDIAAAMPSEAGLDLDALMNCIGALEVRARTVLHLSFYRDKRADEIAAALETSPGNVRVLRHRALAQLRDCLGASEAA